MAGAAIGVVRSQNVVHAALYLVVVLAGAAAQYILLAAEFVAWVQVLIYIGAIVILFLFGIMLTRAPMRGEGELDNNQRLAAAVVSAVPLRRAHRAARRRLRRQGDQARGRRSSLIGSTGNIASQHLPRLPRALRGRVDAPARRARRRRRHRAEGLTRWRSTTS